MAKNKRKKTASRVKYEVKRPTFRFRIYAELKARIQEVKKAGGISNTNIEEAAELYAGPYQCSICGKEIVVQTQEEKKAIKTYMREHGWGHGDCIARRYS